MREEEREKREEQREKREQGQAANWMIINLQCIVLGTLSLGALNRERRVVGDSPTFCIMPVSQWNVQNKKAALPPDSLVIKCSSA
jgi:hypothetical protein